jgi:cytochrome c556
MIAPCAVNASAKSVQEVINERQKGFKVMGRSMRTIGKMFRSGKVDQEQLEQAVNAIEQQSTQLPTWFVQKSSSSHYETEALPIIWQQNGEFKQRARELQNAVKQVQSLLQAHEQRLKPALIKLRNTCSSCHDKFKAE